MTPLTFGSLFAGIGGFDLGLERAGMVCKWQVEIDEFCRRVLTKHWSDVPKFGDIRDCGKHNLEAVDVICGGPPCQPASIAGKRRGEEDDRWLWPEAIRIVGELHPTWCVFENPPGIITLLGGMVFEKTLTMLESEGYEIVPPLVIPACAIGAAHRRDRVFILAYATSLRCEGNRKLATRLGMGQDKKGSYIVESGSILSNSDGAWEQQLQGSLKKQWRWVGNGGQEIVSDTKYNPIQDDKFDGE